jgi:transcriptional regulator with XRE-family HTH domain
MGHLQALIDAWLTSQERSPSWLAGKMGTGSSTLSSWKQRGSRPSPPMMRALSAETGIDHRALVAAADADAGYLTDAELAAILKSTRLTPALRAALEAQAGSPAPRKRKGA